MDARTRKLDKKKRTNTEERYVNGKYWCEYKDIVVMSVKKDLVKGARRFPEHQMGRVRLSASHP